MTKHAFGVYSTTPPSGRSGPGAGPGRPGQVPITDTYDGPATVATYTVVHDRGGRRSGAWPSATCRTAHGPMAGFEEPDLLAHAEETEWVGARCGFGPLPTGVNHVHP